MNPKRHNQIERALQTLDKSRVSEILKDDRYLLFLFKKTERITAACYILTGMYPDLEPLKWKLRDASTDLMINALSFREKTTVQTQDAKNQFLIAVAKNLSLFDMAFVAHLISPMNLFVIKKELEGLQQIVENKDRADLSIISSHVIGEDFFGISKHLFGASFSENKATEGKEILSGKREGIESRQHIQSLNEFERFERKQAEFSKGHDSIKDNVLYEKDMPSISVSDINIRTKSFEKRYQNRMNQSLSGKLNDERKKIILDLIKRKGSAMIKDLSGVITQCSEKTIQRRLSDLVVSGVLKKKGERRWSKYYLL